MPSKVKLGVPAHARRVLVGSTDARVYTNGGNWRLLRLFDRSARTVLDVGCGAGDNSAFLRAQFPEMQIFGVTSSEDEATIARSRMTQCWVADLERGLPPEAQRLQYDAMIFSHVLEHLRDPAELVAQAATHLRPGGCCVIAVPNVLVWAHRARFALGRFEYEASGTMDETHLRFFTYETAARYLLAKSPNLRLVSQTTNGYVPLPWLREHLLPARTAERIDALGCRLWPNLFGWEVLIRAEKQG